jgi:hypothetical protein
VVVFSLFVESSCFYVFQLFLVNQGSLWSCFIHCFVFHYMVVLRFIVYFYAADVHLLHKNIQDNFLPRFLPKSVVKIGINVTTLWIIKRGKTFTTLKSVVKLLPRFILIAW